MICSQLADRHPSSRKRRLPEISHAQRTPPRSTQDLESIPSHAVDGSQFRVKRNQSPAARCHTAHSPPRRSPRSPQPSATHTHHRRDCPFAAARPPGPGAGSRFRTTTLATSVFTPIHAWKLSVAAALPHRTAPAAAPRHSLRSLRPRATPHITGAVVPFSAQPTGPRRDEQSQSRHIGNRHPHLRSVKRSFPADDLRGGATPVATDPRHDP